MVDGAEEAGLPPGIVAARADLNGDGADEVLAMAIRPFACCRATGCPAAILQDGALVADVAGDAVTLGDGDTGGWRDLVLEVAAGHVTATWTGETYAVAGATGT